MTNPTDPTIPVRCVNCDYVGSAVLNEYESLIYRSIIHEMSDFKDPASVELMDVWEGEANYYGETEMFYYLTISAKNSFGGRVKENYYIRKDAYYYDQLMVAPSYYRKQTAFEVNDFLINSQIQKYIQQQGWE